MGSLIGHFISLVVSLAKNFSCVINSACKRVNNPEPLKNLVSNRSPESGGKVVISSSVGAIVTNIVVVSTGSSSSNGSTSLGLAKKKFQIDKCQKALLRSNGKNNTSLSVWEQRIWKRNYPRNVGDCQVLQVVLYEKM